MKEHWAWLVLLLAGIPLFAGCQTVVRVVVEPDRGLREYDINEGRAVLVDVLYSRKSLEQLRQHDRDRGLPAAEEWFGRARDSGSWTRNQDVLIGELRFNPHNMSTDSWDVRTGDGRDYSTTEHNLFSEGMSLERFVSRYGYVIAFVKYLPDGRADFKSVQHTRESKDGTFRVRLGRSSPSFP
ncbi:MAG: hypothetical protein EA376_01830 [Phycisphaeraceae bacterium]|nr:MAG: hypothetical protein EA376_01830 [Phycisphaeraceae bacterium]